MKKIYVFLFLIICVIMNCFILFSNAYSNAVIDRIKQMTPVTSYPISTSIENMDTVTFGNYYNKMDEYGIYNKEPIEWILVNRDDKNALLMSKYILDSKPFNDKKPNFSGGKYVSRTGDYLSCDWKHSSLREWMTEVLYNEMFNESEKSIINKGYIDDTYIYDYSENSVLGFRTEDSIFLLNEKELFYYFGKNKVGEEFVIKSTKGTDYANNRRGLSKKSSSDWSNGNSDYMLRPTGDLDNKTITIEANGSYRRGAYISEEHHGVRPCIFIKLIDTIDMGRMKLDGDPRKETDAVKEGIDLSLYETMTIGKKSVDGVDTDFEWYVIYKENGKALLLSKTTVKRMGFVKKKDKIISWDTSEVRRYLNNDFYNETFNEAEKSIINNTNIITISNPNSAIKEEKITLDKIFILSYDEIVKYIGLDNKMILLGKNNNDTIFNWFIRTPGTSGKGMAYVDSDAIVNLKGDDYAKYVRPAMWVNIN